MPQASFEWFVAFRYLTARRKQAFISLISGVSILGVCVGVMALVIALALMTGVQSELRDRIVGSTAHILVYKAGERGFEDVAAETARVRVPGVIAVAPAVQGPGLMTSSPGTSSFVMLKGIDPAREREVTDIASAMKSGSLDALAGPPQEGHPPGVVLGADLAASLGVKVGDLVSVVSPEGILLPTGRLPRSSTLRVDGTFQFGFYEFDTQYGLVSLGVAEHLFDKTTPDDLQVRVARLDDAPAIAAALQDRLGVAYQVTDWTELNRPLYSALSLEKMAISLTIGLIVIVAALNIVASLVLLVMEKSRDIAILRTMGASSRAVRRIFLYQGLAIGLTGTLAGTVFGLITCWVSDRYRLFKLPSDVYQISYLPFHVRTMDVIVVVVAAVAVCFLATIYPSRQAARLDPAEALRYE